jgi:DNA-binding HxlR family transcriptional regulator
MARSYSHYCPIAHALDLVGERWSLLVVRELQHGPLRYTDLLEQLPGVSTNVLAARLRELEQAEIVGRRRLPAPAASAVYELTDLGRGLTPVLAALAHWGARSLGPPPPDAELVRGWLERALRTALADTAPPGRFELHVGDEVASVVDGVVVAGATDDPDVIVRCDATGVFHLLVDGEICANGEIVGDRDALERLAAAGPARQAALTPEHRELGAGAFG